VRSRKVYWSFVVRARTGFLVTPADLLTAELVLRGHGAAVFRKASMRGNCGSGVDGGTGGRGLLAERQAGLEAVGGSGIVECREMSGSKGKN
jgi:hypothetical protein